MKHPNINHTPSEMHTYFDIRRFKLRNDVYHF